MKKVKLTVLVLVAILFSSLMTFFFYANFYVLKVDTMKMNGTIGDKVGFVLDNHALHFGTTYPGGMSEKVVWFINDYEFPTRITIQTYGDLAPHVGVEENGFTIGPKDRKSARFIMKAPADIMNVTLNGTVRVTFTRVLG
jgi:hypothetical protein